MKDRNNGSEAERQARLVDPLFVVNIYYCVCHMGPDVGGIVPVTARLLLDPRVILDTPLLVTQEVRASSPFLLLCNSDDSRQMTVLKISRRL